MKLVFSETDYTPPEQWFEYVKGEAYLIRYTPKSLLGKLSDEELFNLMLQDWKGIVNEKKKEVVCDAESKKAFLVDDSFLAEKRRRWILLKATIVDNFIDYGELLKNSAGPSNGETSTQKQHSTAAA